MYDEGNYDSAVALYSQVVNANFESKNLYYNLGNAHFKNNDLAAAIYYYERAKKLAPNDADIAFNLSMANSQIVDKLEERPVPILSQAYMGVSSLFTANQWAWLSLLFFVLLVAGVSIFLLTPAQAIKRLSFFGAASFLMCFVITFIVAAVVKNGVASRTNAIVFGSTINVKAEPKISAADLFVIHEGTKVKVLDNSADWSRIALPDGNEGWVPNEEIKAF
jgi:hypothetical protein